MSYQVLARKWRPKIFREMVGQEHVLQALINALDHDRLHHAYLFTGTRGVGKTTIARILAKCLNCETGVSSEPCGECSSCIEINEGRFVDLIEVDAASRTKVEDTRELLDNVQYAPTRGRYKIYLIDEVHMLSNHSFNALLKTLEEPPEHVKFLLATTDPQKLPVTILSRCLQFNLKNMSPERIVGHLSHVLTEEMIPYDDAGLWQIARSADGSMRDALSLTDQAIAFGGNKISEQDVSAMLGTIDHQLIQSLMSGLIESDGTAVLNAVAKFAEHSPDYGAALADLQTLLHRIAIAQALPEALDNSYGDRKVIMEYAQKLASEDVQLYYQISLVGRRDLPLASNPRSGFEMTLLRMLAFKPQGVVDIPTASMRNRVEERVESISSEDNSLEDNSVKKKLIDKQQPVKQEEDRDIALVAKEAERLENQKDYKVEPSRQKLISPDEVKSNFQESPSGHTGNPTNIDLANQLKKEDPSKDFLRSQLKAQVKEIVGKEGITEQVKREDDSTPVSDVRSKPSHKASSAKKIAFDQFTPNLWINVFRQLNVRGIVQSTVANCVCVGKEDGKLYFILDSEKASLFDASHQQRMMDIISDYFELPVRIEINVGAVEGEMESPAIFIEREKAEARKSAIEDMRADPVVQTLIGEFGATFNEASLVLSKDGT